MQNDSGSGDASWPNMRPSTPTPEKGTRDARRRKRLKIALPLHVRPFDARFADIEDVGQVIDFTRDGLYFTTSMPHYSVGMRLMITFPFGDRVSAHRKFLGSIVRLEDLGANVVGIAVRFLL